MVVVQDELQIHCRGRETCSFGTPDAVVCKAARSASAVLAAVGPIVGIGVRATSPAAATVTRKALFRKGDAEGDATTSADTVKTSQSDNAIVDETLTALREELNELGKTSWLYEGNDANIATRVKI